jgi:glycosyltransferase involved in cell wall biosynthesis
MKVIQINLVANLWSTGKIAADIGEAVIAEGGESHLAYGLEYKDCNSKLIQITKNEFRWKIHYYLFSTILDLPGWGSWFETKMLIRKIKKIKPDIIHLHHIYWAILNINVLFHYLKEANIPVIWTFHDCWAFTGGCSHFTSLNCDKWKTQCHNCPRFIKKSKVNNIIDNSRFNYNHKKRIFNNIPNMTITTVSEWLESLVKESYLSSNQIKVIYNGINTDVFYPRKDTESIRKKYGIKKGFVILGVASNWGKLKGLFDFMKLRKILTKDYSIILIGLTEAQVESLPEGIIGIERTSDQNELAALYSIADVVLSLSSEETFGLTPIEGFACGTPAIVYNNTSLPELITSEVGLVAETGNVEQVKLAILEIKRKGKAEYTFACRQHALNLYKREDMARNYLNLYKELLQNEK